MFPTSSEEWTFEPLVSRVGHWSEHLLLAEQLLLAVYTVIVNRQKPRCCLYSRVSDVAAGREHCAICTPHFRPSSFTSIFTPTDQTLNKSGRDQETDFSFCEKIRFFQYHVCTELRCACCHWRPAVRSGDQGHGQLHTQLQDRLRSCSQS